MPITILKPNGTVANPGPWTIRGAATAHGMRYTSKRHYATLTEIYRQAIATMEGSMDKE